MALPLFFAACSQEEIVTENNVTDLSSRKVVGEVTINLDEESMSRMAFVGGETPYKWEAGDQFGACLMDEPANGAATPSYSSNVNFWNRFDLVDYIHTNYPFTRQKDGSWTSEAVMSEGNYFFYYPFNNNLGGRRSAIKVTIPTKQVLADGAKASSALDQQLFVGYSSVQAKAGKEKESVTVKMEPLLAFPGFRLKSSGNSTEAITVRKIAFHSGSKTFPVQYEVKPATAEFDACNYETNPYENAATKRANLVKIAKEGGKANQVSLVFGEKGKTLKAGQSALGYIMLPPMNNLTDPMLYIYTDKGLGRVDLSAAHTDAGDATGVTNIPNDRALTDIAYNDGAIVNIEFDNTAFDQPFEMQVRSTDELVDLVYWSRNNTDAALKATLMNDEIELDPEIIKMLKNNSKISLTINGNGRTLTIPAKTANDALLQKLTLNVKNLKVAKGANIKVPTLKTTDENGIVLTEVKNINNYGTIELVTTSTNPTIYNEGTINVTGAWVSYRYVASVNDISNWGTVNVNAGETYLTKVDNKYTGKANFNGGTTTVAKISNDFYDNSTAEYKRGEITIASGATLMVTEGSNKGLVTVNGTLNGALDNEADNKDTRSGYTSIIPSEIKNSGVVKNINNYGLVTMVVKGAHLQTAYALNGYVNNNVESPYITKVTGETIFVSFSGSYKASDVEKKLKATNALELRLAGTLTADPIEDGDGWSYIYGNQDKLNIVANGNLKIEGLVCFYAKNKSQNTVFTVNAYTTTDVATDAHLWLGKGTLIVNGTLNINSAAEVTAHVGSGLSNINEYGTLNNKTANDETAAAIAVKGYVVNAGVYEVYNAKGLNAVANLVNGNQTAGLTEIKLMDNINFNNNSWTSIIWEDNGTDFFTFDGNGKTIMNVKASQGLFGQYYNNDEKSHSSVNVENLTLDKVEIANTSEDIWVGAVVAGTSGDIENVKVFNSKVTNSTNDARIGGIVGFWSDGYIFANCHVENTTVAGGKAAGGIVGTISADATGTFDNTTNTVTNVKVSVNLDDQTTAGQKIGVDLR